MLRSKEVSRLVRIYISSPMGEDEGGGLYFLTVQFRISPHPSLPPQGKELSCHCEEL